MVALQDRRPEDQSGRTGRSEETRPEKSAHVCRRHAEGPAGLQAHGQHGPEGQPEAGQEGGQGGGESSPSEHISHIHRVSTGRDLGNGS